MKILRIKKLPIFDVFVGEGWYNWSRIIYQHKSIKLLDGEKLSALDHLSIHQYMKTNYQNA